MSLHVVLTHVDAVRQKNNTHKKKKNKNKNKITTHNIQDIIIY